MNPQLRRLATLRAKLTSDTITVSRQCPHCLAWVASYRATACGQHPPAPAAQPGDRAITIRRNYGLPPHP